MAIEQVTVDDVKTAVAFADDVRAVYLQLKSMQDKIARYGSAAYALATGTATAREAKFVAIVQMLIDEADLARISTLQPSIAAFIEEIEIELPDFIQ